MEYQVSVVMPALNEQGNIVRAVENVVQAYKRLNISGELVMIDDGSSDRTGELMDELIRRYSFLKKVRHESPQGVGRSYWDGVQVASGEVVTMLPGDGENDAEEILRYLPLMKDVDVVVPFVFNTGTRSKIRRLVSALYRNTINLTFGTRMKYFNGTVLYRRSILKNFKLQSSGFFYQTELIIKCMNANYLFAEVPYGLLARGSGASKALSFKSLYRVSGDFLRLKLELRDSQPDLEPSSVSYQRRQKFSTDTAAPAFAITPGMAGEKT